MYAIKGKSKGNFWDVFFIVHWSCSAQRDFRLMALQNRVECQCNNETNISPSLFKNATKNIIIFNFVLCQVILILFSTGLNTENNISFVKTILKTLLITVNFAKS